MNRQTSRWPMARCSSAAVTALSTPTDTGISTFALPMDVRASSMSAGAKFSTVQLRGQPQMEPAKFSRIVSPSGSLDST